MTGPGHRRKQKLRKQAHRQFDRIWLSGSKSRSRAYRWLSWKLGIEPSECHFGRMSVEQLLRAIEVCEEIPTVLSTWVDQEPR